MPNSNMESVEELLTKYELTGKFGYDFDELIAALERREERIKVEARLQAFDDIGATDLEGTLNRLINTMSYIDRQKVEAKQQLKTLDGQEK